MWIAVDPTVKPWFLRRGRVTVYLHPLPFGGERETIRRLVFFNATLGCHVHPDERCRPVRTNGPPPSGEVRVPLYGRHRLFSELARDTHTNSDFDRSAFINKELRLKIRRLMPAHLIVYLPGPRETD